MQSITTNEAASMIRESQGKLFGVTFIKRSTGSSRHMVARVGVSQGVTGEGQKFNPRDHNLLNVYEFVTQPDTTRDNVGRFIGGGNMAKQFRCVPIENIRQLRIAGKEFQVS